jgi:hypothetical protein
MSNRVGGRAVVVVRSRSSDRASVAPRAGSTSSRSSSKEGRRTVTFASSSISNGAAARSTVDHELDDLPALSSSTGPSVVTTAGCLTVTPSSIVFLLRKGVGSAVSPPKEEKENAADDDGLEDDLRESGEAPEKHGCARRKEGMVSPPPDESEAKAGGPSQRGGYGR